MSRRATFGIVGAYGATGRAVVSELLRSETAGILLGGRDSAKLSACAAEFGSRVSPLNVDIQDSRSLEEFCSQCSIVINCAGPVTVLQDRVAQAALRAGCHYVDPAGMSLVKERLLSRNHEIAERGLSFVVSAGWAPGIIDLLPIHAYSQAQAQMDSIQAVEVFFSDSEEWSDSALRDGVSHLRSFGLEKPGYFRKGQWVQVKTSEASLKIDIGSPIGLRRFSLFYTPELKNAGRRLTGCDFRAYSYLAGFRNALDAVMIALFPLSESSAVRRLRNIFRRNQLAVGGFVVVRVHGHTQGRDATLRSAVTFDAGRGYRFNGAALATVARLISRKTGVRPGIHFLSEAVDPAILMPELRESGIHYTTP